MSRITVIGGTGYAGRAIVEEAVSRGHEVTVVARTAPLNPVPGVVYVEGSALDASVRTRAFDGADTVISATSPRGDMAVLQLELVEALAARAALTKARLVVIGGFSSLRPAEGEPRFIDGFVPDAIRAEAQAGHSSLELLRAEPAELDWTFVSPARYFGSFAPGETTGEYRIGGEVAILDQEGKSYLSAGDLAIAVLDVVEAGTHRREHISVVH